MCWGGPRERNSLKKSYMMLRLINRKRRRKRSCSMLPTLCLWYLKKPNRTSSNNTSKSHKKILGNKNSQRQINFPFNIPTSAWLLLNNSTSRSIHSRGAVIVEPGMPPNLRLAHGKEATSVPGIFRSGKMATWSFRSTNLGRENRWGRAEAESYSFWMNTRQLITFQDLTQ